MATSTTALVLNEINGPFSLETIQIDAIRPNEAMVEIHATGICHTDIACSTGALPASAPAVLGHEGAGLVKAVGSDISGIAVGDKVLLSFAHCQTCEQCKSSHPAYCYSFTALNFGGQRGDGSSVMTQEKSRGGKPYYSGFFGQSSFSNHAVVAGSSLVKVPHDTDLALFSPLGCGFQTGAGVILNTLDVQAGSSVAVFGVGSVGMSAIMAAKMRGAKDIIAIDLQQSRLDLARTLGANHSILGNDPDLMKKVTEIAPPNGVNYAVDCSGVVPVIETMIDCLGSRGQAASVGAPSPGKRAGVDVFSHVINGRKYAGCCEGDSVPSKIIPYLMGQHAKGNYPLEKVIKFYDIKDFQQAIDDTNGGKTLKAVLRWK